MLVEDHEYSVIYISEKVTAVPMFMHELPTALH